MEQREHLLIFGASARAAAFSALRANLSPWCADLFGDRDLEARCPSIRIPPSRYPHALLELAGRELPGPWIYTGGLENRPVLVNQMARLRPLWGNHGRALEDARSPSFVAFVLKDAGLPYPAVRKMLPKANREGVWLVKPLSGSGGSGIRFWTGRQSADIRRRRVYFQEYVQGEACAANYLGDGQRTRLLGVTRQLVGESWLHAAPFHHCGSIGPLALEPGLQAAFERMGRVLAEGCGLRGLFGVDCVLRGGVAWPVEVNPRYTASIEVLEFATGIAALGLHRKIFDPTAPEPLTLSPGGPVVGKAILFAKKALSFPSEEPWLAALRSRSGFDEPPAYADIPHAGERIEAGRPVLTFFSRAHSVAECHDSLRLLAEDLDHWLFGQ